MVKVTHITYEPRLLSGILGGKDGFGGHHEVFDAIIFNEVHGEQRSCLLRESRRWMPENDHIVNSVCVQVEIYIYMYIYTSILDRYISTVLRNCPNLLVIEYWYILYINDCMEMKV